jgi:short-subunit dehydrogenase
MSDAGGRPLQGTIAAVTGATSGIGREIALHLAREGSSVCAIGRSTSALVALAEQIRRTGCPEPRTFEVDLTDDASVHALATAFRKAGRADVLVHCAGAHSIGTLAQTPVEELDSLFRVNVRAPYLLTQLLLPLLRAARGQIVFINSSQGIGASAGVGAYAATKHALKALADSLRDEVNGDGIRVLSAFPGRTATPSIERLFAAEGRHYDPAVLLQPADVARVVVGSLLLPRTAEVTNLSIRPSVKSY